MDKMTRVIYRENDVPGKTYKIFPKTMYLFNEDGHTYRIEGYSVRDSFSREINEPIEKRRVQNIVLGPKDTPSYIAPSKIPPDIFPEKPVYKGLHLLPKAYAGEGIDLICETKKTSDSSGLIRVGDWCLPYTITPDFKMVDPAKRWTFGDGVFDFSICKDDSGFGGVEILDITFSGAVLEGNLCITFFDYQNNPHTNERPLVWNLETGLLRVTSYGTVREYQCLPAEEAL